MTREAVEFVIDSWVAAETGRFTVIGRCGDVPIRTGETFDVVYSVKPKRYPEGLGEPSIVDCVEPVSLTVECIHAYDLSLQELGEGMTGMLVLRGDGFHHVAPGWVLGRSEDLQTLAGSSLAPTHRPAE